MSYTRYLHPFYTNICRTMVAKVILKKIYNLTLPEVVKLLHDAMKNPNEMVSFVPPVEPSAGDVFVYSLGENLHKIGKK